MEAVTLIAPGKPETQKLLTAEEFFYHPLSASCELVRGRIVSVSPSSYEHGIVTLKLGRLIGNFVAEHHLGDVLGAETGFTIHEDPDTVRAPDIAFVAGARRPADSQGFVHLAPDLAVEVASPHDQADEIQAKVEEFLTAGTKMVWVVYPKTRSVAVYRSLRDVKILRGDEALSGEDVLAGFECKVSEVFE